MDAIQSVPHHRVDAAQAYAMTLERMNRFQEPEARLAIADLDLPPGSRGLDVGCGVGLYTLWLAEAIGPGGQVIGLDQAAERVKAAERLVGTTLPRSRMTFQQGNGTAIEADDGTFDWLWCGDVLHHIDDPLRALREFRRVVRPGGKIIVKESQVFHALFLPGYTVLERQLQRAEIQHQQPGAGARPFQERRQRTRATMLEADLSDVRLRTYVVERQAPLDEATYAYIQHVVFARNWGPRLRGFLDAKDWQQRSALCEDDSPQAILARPDYYCLYPITVFTAPLPQ
ncbi:2-phytyl-1,4-beta-naphthoquinone methyltransferase, chloroplastic [Candidatus Entotheonellaceae bacterium PAL068K]